MSLNRNQATLCALGGVFAVGAGVLGWFLWSAISESGEALEDRDRTMDAIDSFYSAKVFPSAESLEAVNANAAELSEWCENARLVASRGDKAFVETTPPSFKQFLQSEQVRLSALPGKADGKICAAGFAFGFDKYLGQNPTMPDRADLPKLQRQLDFIAEAVEIFSESGVDEVKGVKRDDTAAVAADAEEPRPAKRPASRGGKGKAAEDEGPVVTSLEYSFQILASPKALVAVMNRLNSEFRFTVVTELNFTESHDVIVEKLAERDKAESDAKNALTSSRRGRRRNRGEAADAAPEELGQKSSEGGMVIDPEIDAPLVVDIAVRVYDFGRGIPLAEPAPAGEAPAAPAAGETPAAPAAGEAPAAPAAESAAPAPAAPAPAAPADEAKEETAK